MDILQKTQRPRATHRWRFFRSGGFDQVQLDTAADILNLDQLDKKLWAALSCPTVGLEMDNKTLAMLDTDKDGRIRAPELIAAVNWTGTVLKKPQDLTLSSATLPLNAIDTSTPAGEEILASAQQILSNLGKTEATSISTEDTADPTKIFAHTKFNGDGIITVETTDDQNIKTLIQDVIDCMGAEIDRSGDDGISVDKVTKFFESTRAYVDWWTKSETNRNIYPMGENTTAAVAAYDTVKQKIDDYFTRCQLAAFDSRAANHLNCAEEKYDELATQALSANTEALTTLPLAAIDAAKPLPLELGINPFWYAMMAEFRKRVVMPLFGSLDKLDAKQWTTLKTKFSAYETWLAEKDGSNVEQLGIERLREILSDPGEDILIDMITKDKILETEIEFVDRLVHYYRDLYILLNNFVSLRDFYTGKIKAIFQAGTLYLDGRSCELCIKIDNIATHSKLAALSLTYLTYCDCYRRGSNETMTIVAAFTDGDADNLMVGRNGVFFDRNGDDWDAVIVKIIEHPISIRQAFWLPYKRFSRMIGQQIEKIASSRDKAMQDKAGAGVSGAATNPGDGKATTPPPFDVGKFAGIFAAIGLAIGAIGTILAAIAAGFFSLLWWQMPLAIIGVILLISCPSMVLAWLKLRKRTLAPILDASGWAVNTRAKINIPFGATLTGVATLPKNAHRSLKDPFAVKKTPWKRYVLLLAIIIGGGVIWQKGYLAEWNDKGYFPKWIQPTIEKIPSPETTGDKIQSTMDKILNKTTDSDTADKQTTPPDDEAASEKSPK